MAAAWLRTKGSVGTSGEDWDRVREVVEPAVDEVAKKVRTAGVEVGLLGAALVVAGTNLINETAGPDEAARLLENLIEGLEGGQ